MPPASPPRAATRCLRKRLCDAIASAAKQAGADVHAEGEGLGPRLDEIFKEQEDASALGDDGDGEDGDDENVTPLMVACDARCSEALSYLQTQIRTAHEDAIQELRRAWGHPTEASRCGNGPAHHAAAAGFILGFDALVELCGSFQEGAPDARGLDPHLSLLSQTNRNGDTPLMMACVFGKAALIKHVVEKSLTTALRANPSDPDTCEAVVAETWRALAEVFDRKNDEGRTAVTLACGHGHADVVIFALRARHVEVCARNEALRVTLKSIPTEGDPGDERRVYHLAPLVNVTYADVEFCKKTAESHLKFMKQQSQPETVNQFREKLARTNECCRVIESELERIATSACEQLLESKDAMETEERATTKAGPTSKAKSKRKKKKKKHGNNNHNNDGSQTKAPMAASGAVSDEEKKCASWAHVKGTQENEGKGLLCASPFITLQDGSVVSSTQQSQRDVQPPSDDSCVGDTVPRRPDPAPLQSILKDSTAVEDDSSLCAIMESLCLHPSMLLLSPHGMAMEMSPCQLDAIESILVHQLDASKKAQRIQSRLLDKSDQ